MIRSVIRMFRPIKSQVNLDHTKSLLDEKNYRVLSLLSGLEVLLVSTKTKTESRGEVNVKAAAAMSVQVGSFADPELAEGTAHFLEHMVFMGSNKYPDENYYDSYVTSHGGSCNAFTEGEYTTYQFDINSASFSHCLDIFANCFISPLLSANAMKREVNAINSEFNLAKTNDGSRAQQLFCHGCSDNHVLRKFSWGNAHSLSVIPESRGVDVRDILRSFHRKHYQANNMKLVVVGPFTMEKLEEDVLASFGEWNSDSSASASTAASTAAAAAAAAAAAGELDLADQYCQSTTSEAAAPVKKLVTSPSVRLSKKMKTDDVRNDARASESPVTAAAEGLNSLSLDQILFPLKGAKPVPLTSLNVFTRVVPIKQAHILKLQFQLPPTAAHYRTKPWEYVSHCVGHEGPNSLLSLLKNQLSYATNLSCGISGTNVEDNSLFSLMEVWVTLTDKGFANWTEVCSLVHQYLRMLRERGPQEWIHNEIKQLSDVYYRFLDEEEPSDLAERLSVEMLPYHQRRREDLLGAAYLHYEWDPQGVEELLEKHLTVRNAKITLSSPVFAAAAGGGGVPTAVSVVPSGESESDSEESNEEGESEDDEEGSGSEGDEGDDESSVSSVASASAGGAACASAPSVLTVDQLTALYTGPSGYLSFILPPTTAPLSEPHFGTLHWQTELSEDLLQYWEQAFPNMCLALPPVNPYIPENLSMLSERNASSTAAAGGVSVDGIHLTEVGHGSHGTTAASSVPPPPVRVPVTLDGVTLWHRVNEQFHSPKAELYCKLASPEAFATVSSAVHHELMTSLLKDAMNEEMYMASMADLNSEFTCSDVAMVIKISGYSDKAVRLFNNILCGLIQVEELISDKALSREIEQLKRTYSNANLKSSQCCQTARLRLLVRSKYATEKKLEVLTSGQVTMQSLHVYIRAFRRALSVEWLVEGNVSLDDVQQLPAYLAEGVATASVAQCPTGTVLALSSKNIPVRPTTCLAPSTVTVLRSTPRNPLENNNCVDVYFQLGAYSLEDVTLLDLLEQLITEPYFDNLRTKQQLGYSVSCGVRQTYGVLGFCFQVVSSAFPVDTIQESMLTFIEQIEEEVIGKMSEELYLNNVTALVDRKLQPDLSLSDSAVQNWSEIDEYRYDFEAHRRQAALLLVRQQQQQQNAEGTAELTALSQRESVKNFCRRLFTEAPKVLILQASRQESAKDSSASSNSVADKHLKQCTWSVVETVEELHASTDRY